MALNAAAGSIILVEDFTDGAPLPRHCSLPVQSSFDRPNGCFGRSTNVPLWINQQILELRQGLDCMQFSQLIGSALANDVMLIG